MKKKFIKFNDINGIPVVVNVEHIVSITEMRNNGRKEVTIVTSDGYEFPTCESFRDICNKLESEDENSDF